MCTFVLGTRPTGLTMRLRIRGILRTVNGPPRSFRGFKGFYGAPDGLLGVKGGFKEVSVNF